MKPIKLSKQIKNASFPIVLKPSTIPHFKKGLCFFFFFMALLYYPSMHGEFILDDQIKIVNNPDIRDLSNIFEKLIYPYKSFATFEEKVQSPRRNDPSRPVVYLTYAVNYALGKLDPFNYHVTNVLLHFVNAVLILIFTRRLWQTVYKESMNLGPILVALFFAIHPIASSTVSYIFSRSDLLACLFILLGLILFQRKELKFSYLGSLLCYVFALFSKQSAIVFPILVLILDWLIFSPEKTRINISRHVGYFTVLFVYLFWRVFYFGSIGDVEAWGALIDPALYLLTQGSSIVRYVQMELLPVNLSMDHGLNFAMNYFDVKMWASWILLLAVFGFIFLKCRALNSTYRLVLFYLGWFLITLSPTSSIFPTTAALVENRLYLPSIAFSGLLVLLYQTILNWSRTKKRELTYVILIFIGIHILMLSGATFKRNFIFETGLNMWTDVIQTYPGNARAHQYLGEIYAQNSKDYQKAAFHFENVATIYKVAGFAPPPGTHNNIGAVYFLQNKIAEAGHEYMEEIKIDPKSSSAYRNLGMIYFLQKKYDDAELQYRKALQINPNFEQAKIELEQAKRRGL